MLHPSPHGVASSGCLLNACEGHERNSHHHLPPPRVPRGSRLRCSLPPLARSNQEVRFPTWDLHPKRLTLSLFVMLTKPAVPL